MRLVRISDLSEEERKKALEDQQARQEANRQASEQARQNANERFNELVSKRGEYDTSKHTTTINRLKKAYKGKSSYKTVNNSLNSYYQRNKNQNNSMWNQIQNRAEENNRFNNNSRLMLYNNRNKSEGNILDNLRNWVFGNSVASNREKKNNTQEKEEKENKTILDTKLSKEKQTNKLTTFAEQDKILASIKKEADIQEKNDNIWQDIAGVANLAGLGISSGSKEVLNYIENANENNFNNYENIKKQQFLTSPNVSEEDKAVAKSQDNLLLQKNGINVEQKIETNLVKKAIRDSINKDEEKISDITSKISNKGMQKLADIAPSMGQMLPGTLLNAVNPILGTSYFMTSSGGSYIEDAKKRGMNDEQAFKYGTIMGILEGASESFITGQQVNKVSKALMGKEVSKDILNSYGFNMFENAIQEAVMEPAQEMTAGIVGGKDKADWNNIGVRMAESGFNGALMGAITNGVTYGLEKSIKVYNKIKNKENVTPKEYKEALQENIDKFGDKAVEQGIRQGATETYQEINRINNSGNQSSLQNTNINQQQNQNNIDTTNMSFEDSAKAYNLDTNNETIKAVNQALSNRGITGRFDANIFSNSNENAIWRTYTDEKGNTKREVIFNPNGNSQATMQQISIHELTHDLAGTKEIDELKNLVLDRNKKMQGYAEARQSLENTYSQVYDTNSKDFKSLVDDEEVADTLAQKLGDQEFVNSLSTEKPTVFKRIYDWVVDKVNKITGNKIEKVYWEDIKNKFKNAYRQTYQGETNQTKYSFVGENSRTANINKLQEALNLEKQGKTAQEIYEKTGWYRGNEDRWRYEIDDSNFNIKDNVIKKDGWYRLEEILNADELYKAYPELKRAEIYFEDLGNGANGYFDGKNGIYLDNSLINEKTDAKSYSMLGLKNQNKVYSDLMHEIQHWIQKKEGFSRGSSFRYWNENLKQNLTKTAESLPAFKKLETTEEKAEFIEDFLNNNMDILTIQSKYRNTAGEQEARDVQNRINMSKEEKRKKLPFIKNEDTIYAQSGNESYSIQTDGNGNKYVKVDTNQDIFEGKDVKDYPKIAKQYILSKFRDGDKSINLPTKENVTVTSKTAREYTHPKKQLPQKVKESKMKASTELDNLISISEYQYSRPDDGRHEFAKDGWDYYKTQFEIDGNTFEGLVNIAKSGNKKTLYDITNIKRINQNHSTSAKAFSTSLVNSNNSITPSQDNVNTTNQSMQNNQNNTLNIPTKKLTEKQRQNRLEYLRNLDTSNMKLLEKTKIKSEIRALENGYNSVEEMRKVEKEQEQKAIQEFKNKQEQKNKRQNDTINNSSMQESGNNSKVDNKGRTLSKKQQEYFKNSKVRDENENLVTLYHGTPNNFTQFNYDYIGSNGTALGKGFYLTDDKKIAESYAGENGNIMELYANIEKPLSLDKINITKKEYKKFIEKVNKKTKGQFLSDYGEVNYEGYNTVLNRAMENYNYNQNDVDLIHEVFNTAGLSWEEGFRLLKDTLGYDGVINEHFNGTESKVYIPTLPEQIKKIDNISPTNNKDIRYSTNTKGAWQEFLDNQIGQRGKGKTVQELRLPTKETINNENIDSYNVLYQDNEQAPIMNLLVSEGGKVRKHYKSIMQSSNTSPEAKAIAKELMGTDTYVPDSNERQLKVADDRIVRNGADNEAVTLATKVKNGDKIIAEDIATGERLIEYYSKIGDKEKLQDSIQNVALAGTQAGQTVQAMSLINRQTPQGQAVYLSKVIDRMNNDIEKRTKGKGKKFELTPEMLEKITTSSKGNLENNIDEVARELANQVPKTTIEKIDSWRYFSMLANPRTHFRNIIGNFSMAGVQSVKNKVAGSLEAIAQKTGMIDKRTKTLKPASMKTRRFAKADVDNVMSRLNNESKFDTRNLIQQYQRTFKSKLLENTLGKLYNLNSKALEKEDVFGLKRGYRKALADYMTANKLTEADLTAGTREADIQLEKARKYAIEQAQEATFHQQSAMASILNTFENKSTATKLITGAVIPFKKTPINVAKAGASYSPLGLVKSFTIDISNLRKGKINANQYIDNLAKGLTGTGIAAVGYALAQAGILSASGDDDDQKNQYYQEDRGNQPFSLKIGDKTYSLDWLAPTDIPLFIGAELNYNVNNSNEEQTAEDVLDRVSNGIDALSSAMNPMIDMSMLSGLASTIKSFSQGDTQVFQNLAINAGKSYINQFFPTLSGQIAKIVDDTERSTTSTKKNAFAKAVDSTGKQILNKIPFASQLLPAKTDVWGNTLKRDSNPLYRGLQQMAFPWTEKSLKSTDVDNAISDLYEETGEKSVLPNTSINKDFTLNGEKYRLTPEEYAEYKKQYGKNSYNLLNGITSSKEYKSMNNEQKTEAISKVYEYANEKNKVDYANKKKVDIETSSLYNTVTSIEKEGGQGSDYFKYLGRITGIEKSEEKIKILEETNIPLKSKSSIYTNTVGKSDEFYSNVLQESNININEYLKYKNQKFESDKKDDGTLEGKTITNSKKKKVYNYVNNMNITYNQKLLILGKQYKLSDSEQKKLYEYINNIPGQTSKEKLEIFKMYTNNFQIYKNGTMSFK